MGSGYLEVQGFSAALSAMDAMCKSANVRVTAVDANNTSNDADAAVTVVIQVKFTGPVADVKYALESGKAAALKTLSPQHIFTHCIASDGAWMKPLLSAGKLPAKRGVQGKSKFPSILAVDVHCFANAVYLLDVLLKANVLEIVDVKKYLGGQIVTLILGGSPSAVQTAAEQITNNKGNSSLKNMNIVHNPHTELFRFLGLR